MVDGFDSDFHRRDLADAIETGAFPRWELGLQVMSDTEDKMSKGIDLSDPTKLVSEELAPVKAVGCSPSIGIRRTISPKPSKWRFIRVTSYRESMPPITPPAAGAPILLSRYADQPPRWAELQ